MRITKFSKLRGRMIEKGYTGKSVAEELGITEHALSNKLTGKSEFTLKEIIAICNLLECTVDYFFDPELHDLRFMGAINS